MKYGVRQIRHVKTQHRRMFAWGLFVCLSLAVAGCESTPTTSFEQPIMIRLTGYDVAQLNVTGVKESEQQQALLERALLGQLLGRGVFESVEVVGSETTLGEDDDAVLLIQVRIDRMKEISDAMRFVAGPLSGQGELEVETTLMDRATGIDLGRFRTTGRTKAGQDARYEQAVDEAAIEIARIIASRR